MDGPRPNNLIAGAICLSLAAHSGLAIVAGTVAVAAGGGSMMTGGHAVPPMLIAWSDEPAPPESEPPEPVKPADEPKAEPPVVPLELEEPVRLGISESDQDTENWMGFEQPTPHSAMRAAVEQPALDPTAGVAAPPGTQSPTTAAGDQAPAAGPPPAPQPLTMPPSTEPPAANPSPPAAQPEEAREATQAPQKPVDAGGLDKSDAEPKPPDDRGTEQPAIEDPDQPLMLEGETDVAQLAEPLADGFVGPPFESSETEVEANESTSAAANAQPQPPAPPPQPAGTPGQQTSVSAPGGTDAPGLTPGEQSDRESDPSSLEDPIEIRLGRPAAAKGLEIVTKRPDFSLVTRMTVYPTKNPRLKVTFNREGRVSDAKFVDPTGLSEVDSPVLHAVYRWTARGEALTRLPLNNPKAGVTITVTILLR